MKSFRTTTEFFLKMSASSKNYQIALLTYGAHSAQTWWKCFLLGYGPPAYRISSFFSVTSLSCQRIKSGKKNSFKQTVKNCKRRSYKKCSCSKKSVQFVRKQTKLGSFLVSIGRSLYIFAAINCADFFANSALSFGIFRRYLLLRVF